MGTRDRERGFVLLLVLVVLAVAGSVLAAAACRATEEAQEAGAAQRALQRKWAFLSIRATCLPQAEKILTGEDNEDAAGDGPKRRKGPVPVSRRFSLALGETPFDLVVADEQSKANVNLMEHRRGKRGLEESLRALQGRGGRFLQVRLRPRKREEGRPKGLGPPLYETFDQVFVFDGPTALLASGSGGTGASDQTTLWGSGKVNFQRADREVLREVARGVLGEFEIDRLLGLREEEPGITLAQALARLKLDGEARAAAVELLTDTSACHSLWIVARGRTRSWHRLCVARTGGAESDSGDLLFAWEP